MEFWVVEVKSGEPLKVAPGHNMVLHLSQACVGELKKEKGNESVCLFVNVDGKKLVLGTLFTEKLPQQQFDLVFDRDFELSHNWKNGTVYFYGYRANNPFDDEPEGESDESEPEEELPLMTVNNVKSEPKAKSAKAAEAGKTNAAKGKESDAGKQKVTIQEPKKVDNPEDYDDSSDDLLSEDDDEDDSEDEDDSDDESGESDEETPKKAETSKKRAAESATKTPIQVKKPKATPQKTDGKKAGGHVDTPHPAKQAGKTPGNKSNQQTPPQSKGPHTCKTCSRTFGSDKALESHSKAKHASK